MPGHIREVSVVDLPLTSTPKSELCLTAAPSLLVLYRYICSCGGATVITDGVQQSEHQLENMTRSVWDGSKKKQKN